MADRKDGRINDRCQIVHAESVLLRDACTQLEYRIVEFLPLQVCRTAMLEMGFLRAIRLSGAFHPSK